MKRDEQIDHCRRLSTSLTHANFSEIASFRVLFSRPTRRSSDTGTPPPAQIPPISLVKEVVEERKRLSFSCPSEALDALPLQATV
jgi:hypothetical protein